MAEVKKVGVMWEREFKNKKKGFKISINKVIYVAYKNSKASKDTDPHYVICQFIDEPTKDEKK